MQHDLADDVCLQRTESAAQFGIITSADMPLRHLVPYVRAFNLQIVSPQRFTLPCDTRMFRHLYDFGPDGVVTSMFLRHS